MLPSILLGVRSKLGVLQASEGDAAVGGGHMVG
jgi:hypothetical protein